MSIFIFNSYAAAARELPFSPKNGARDGTRTHMVCQPADFKSAAYTNSATLAMHMLLVCLPISPTALIKRL